MATGKPAEEWLKQADYDLNVAVYLHEGGHSAYAIFMAHLALEKALKGLYTARLAKEPPKTHSLIYLAEIMKLDIPEPQYLFMATLNQVSVPTRYPEEMDVTLNQYDEARVKAVLQQSTGLLEWIKQQL